MTRVRWGIVGAGTIANTFASDIARVPIAELAAVAARDGDAAARFAEKHAIGRAYQGYDSLFADPDIDAVYVATPHTLHLRNSSDALQAGKAVLCEKPITTSASECQALLDVANESGSYLMEAMWTWFLPALQTAKDWYKAGRIGELRHIKAELGYPKTYDPQSRLFDPELAGGALLDMGVYPIAIARYFTGRHAESMNVVARFAANGVDDDVTMQFDYGDCVASLATSFRCKLPNTAYIIGTQGYIEIPHCWSARECHLFQVDQKVDSFTDDRAGSGFEFQIAAVSDDLLAGRSESRIVTHTDSLAFQRDMDQVRDCFQQ
jgi:predicted dehydrogenase